LFHFSQALRMKSLWRGLTANTLWCQVLIDKYLGNLSAMEWLRQENYQSANSSIIWRGFIEVARWIKLKIAWQVGNGKSVLVGTDQVVSGGLSSTLSESLINHLNGHGYTTLDHFCSMTPIRGDYWFSSAYLGLVGSDAQEWQNYIHVLLLMGINLRQSEDKMVWTHNQSDGRVTAKLTYDLLLQNLGNHIEDWWARYIWKWKVPIKLLCFFWLCLHNRILTWDNLCARGWSGPGHCSLCYGDSETALHLFFLCPYALEVWDYICSALRLDWNWTHDSFVGHFTRWRRKFRKHKSLIIFVCWGIWRCRNEWIFDEKRTSSEQAGAGILGYYLEYGSVVDVPSRGRRLLSILFLIHFRSGSSMVPPRITGGVVVFI